MADLLRETIEVKEERLVRYAEHPIAFESFVDLQPDKPMELVGGVLVEKMAVQLTHEKLFGWLYLVLGIYVRRRTLGIVLGSRTTVEISAFGGRLPDILFVRQNRMDIVRERAVYGAPDLVIELVSPNDRPVDLIGLEADYRSIGVAEIVFIDMQKQHIRKLCKGQAEYTEEILTAGTLPLETVPGFAVQVEWLLQEPRPDEMDTALQLLADI